MAGASKHAKSALLTMQYACDDVIISLHNDSLKCTRTHLP